MIKESEVRSEVFVKGEEREKRRAMKRAAGKEGKEGKGEEGKGEEGWKGKGKKLNFRESKR